MKKPTTTSSNSNPPSTPTSKRKIQMTKNYLSPYAIYTFVSYTFLLIHFIGATVNYPTESSTTDLLSPSIIQEVTQSPDSPSTITRQFTEEKSSEKESPRVFIEKFGFTLPRFSRRLKKPKSKSSKGDKKSRAKGEKATGKQSWLAVANAVAQSAAAESKHSMPIGDESKPTKYHYYPHNQHLYLLPECAAQQVCSAVYLRLNYSQPLCACPNFNQPCSVSTRTDDRHTIPLVTGSNSQVLTLVKTCERTPEIRECRAPKDWSILALQNSRTGKAHYLVICRCPAPGYLEGPIAHSQPAYARVPGIRVYGMTCLRYPQRLGRAFSWSNLFGLKSSDSSEGGKDLIPPFPWKELKPLLSIANLIS